MNYPINELSSDSRIWVFASSSLIDNDIEKILMEDTANFLDNWLAHQQVLKAGTILMHQHFLIIAVDENRTGASGCSIDKLHQFIQLEEKKLNLKLLDRMRVVYKIGDEIKNIAIPDLQQLIKLGEISAKTIVFNPLVESLSSLNTSFEVALQDTWLNRYLIKQPS